MTVYEFKEMHVESFDFSGKDGCICLNIVL